MLRTAHLPLDHQSTARSHGALTVPLPGHTPVEVFAFITDLDALPRWNKAIEEVIERPATLCPGASWRVRMHADGLRWTSRSTLVRCHLVTGEFVYRSGTDDGNPSFTEWWWRAVVRGDGTELTVRWSLHPRTRFRRWFLARYRLRRLRREVPASLERIRHELTGSCHDGSDDAVARRA